MDISFLKDYMIPIVFGICLCVGYILKNVVTTDKVNKYIPLIMGILGVLLASWINLSFTPMILLQGLVSGLASTGCYEAFTKLIKKFDEDTKE